MSVFPNRDDFERSQDGGNLLPVYREILADGETPVSAYAKLGGGDYSFLLESVGGSGRWASYSVVGVSPRAVLKCQDRKAEVIWYDVDGGGRPRRAAWDVDDPTRCLAEVMDEWKPVVPEGLPRFWGGAVGFLSYDAVRAFESLPEKKDESEIPELLMVLTDTIVIFDHHRQTIKVVATPYVPRKERAGEAYERAVARVDGVVHALRQPGPPLPWLETPSAAGKTTWDTLMAPRLAFSREPFEAAVDRVREQILEGDVLTANLAQRLEIDRGRVDSFDMYRALRAALPSPYLYHLSFPELSVSGSSPDTLVRTEKGRVEMRPVAARAARPVDARKDELAAEDLLSDPKIKCRQTLLTDQAVGELGRVSEVGSVSVDRHLSVERSCNAMHVQTEVSGKVPGTTGWHDILRSVFPPATVTGAPKTRAVEILDELEPFRRGVFGGAVGYISYTGDMDMTCADQVLLDHGGRVSTYAISRLDHHSSAKNGYQAAIHKAQELLSCVANARREE